MEGSNRSTWFAGDLGDPWVASIAEALPRDSFRIDCPDDLPEIWPIDRPTPFSMVLHRATLTPTDAQRVARLKARADRTPRIILCVGPQARYVDVERWSRLVDVVLPEATARESVARHALAIDRKVRPPGAGGTRSRVVILSSNHELRATLVEVVRSGGFMAEPVGEILDSPPGIVTVWDVPILEPNWPTRLASLTRSSPVVALLSFADRTTVLQARQLGASACLDLPCDVGDLLAVLDRVALTRLDPKHEVPPPPMMSRGLMARKN